MSDLWVFGYGSLMWRPGFDHNESVSARLIGYHRSLCVYSHVHRGTPEQPGLVLGLDRGGSCRGMAFRVPDRSKSKVIEYLRAREQATMVYREVSIPVFLEFPINQRISALCYLVDRKHVQYAGVLPKEKQLQLITKSVGQSGPNPDYVLNTNNHLKKLGIHDPHLQWLSNQLKSM